MNTISLCCQLVPAYRGYTVDSLTDLQYLDDVIVSIDERARFLEWPLYQVNADSAKLFCLHIYFLLSYKRSYYFFHTRRH